MLNVSAFLSADSNLVFRTLHYLTLALAWLLIFSSTAQCERLPIKIYTSADGLGSSFVDCLLSDSHGFLWFGTRDGLSRFDGAQFVTYRIDENNSGPGIESITETRDGSFWVTTTRGLYRVKGDEVSQPGQPLGRRPLLNAEFISEARGYLVEGRDGTLWFASGYLFQIVQRDNKYSLVPVKLNLQISGYKEPGVSKMTEAKDGSLWLDTSVGLIRRLPDSRIILYKRESNQVGQFRYIISDDREGRIWLIRDLDFFVLKQEPLETLSTNPSQVTVRSLKPTYTLPANAEVPIRLPEKAEEILKFTTGEFLSSYPGHKLFQSSDGHIWLTTNKELVEFDGKVFHRFTTAQGLPDGMSALSEDSAGNIWVGGQTGLARLDRNGLVTYGVADGLHSPSISAINEASDGSLYFADADLYLNQLEGRTFLSRRPGLPASARVLWMSHYALLDRSRKWWILTNEKLYRFADARDRNPLATYTSSDGLKADALFQVFEDSKGQIWVSVQPPNPDSKGLARFDPTTKRFHSFTESEGFPKDKSVSSFTEETNGTLWFGFYEGGLARFKDNQFSIFSPAGLNDGAITDLLIDHSHRLWISSSGGGVRVVENLAAERPKFTSLTAGEGLSTNNVRTITEDKLGNIYFGTVRGIDRLSASTHLIKHYSVSDGLAGDFVVDSHCDKNGILWFATTSGVSRLIPTVEERYAPPPISLGALRIAGVSQSLPELGASELGPLELANTQNNLQVEFFGLDFHAGENLRYQYQLVGADPDWSSPTEQRTITFANLRPGSYRFLVRAINAQGVSSERPAVVSFRILSPIWLRWWFIALISLGVVLIGLAVIKQQEGRRRERARAQMELRRAREDRLRELEQVRRRIAADLHDDIGSNLTRISLISEVARRKIDGSEPLIKDQLNNIGKLSRELIDSMSEIVWAINPHKDHFSDLSQRMRHFASDVLTARQIHFQFRSVESDQDIKVGANVRREFFLIFKEAINNIARHAQCSEVEIELDVKDNRLILSLKDNGKGFDSAKEGLGHGLVSMRERTTGLGGECQIESAVGQGTKLKFSIPVQTEPDKTIGPT